MPAAQQNITVYTRKEVIATIDEMQEHAPPDDNLWTLTNTTQALKFAPLSQLNTIQMSHLIAKENSEVIKGMQ
eukprot:1910317-Ditylum_brightwellii.AAC.1